MTKRYFVLLVLGEQGWCFELFFCGCDFDWYLHREFMQLDITCTIDTIENDIMASIPGDKLVKFVDLLTVYKMQLKFQVFRIMLLILFHKARNMRYQIYLHLLSRLPTLIYFPLFSTRSHSSLVISIYLVLPEIHACLLEAARF